MESKNNRKIFENKMIECPFIKSWVYISQACIACNCKAFICKIELILKRPDKVEKLKGIIMNDYQFDLKILFEKASEYKLPLEKPIFDWDKEQIIKLGQLFGFSAIIKDENEEEIPF